MNLHRIRRIEDDAYIFSMARGFPGRIIASRTRDRGDCSGKNIFDLLRIPKTEYYFLFDMLCEGGDSSIALCSDDGKAVVVFRFFAYGASLLLAIVPNFPVGIFAKLLGRGEFGETLPSPKLRELADGNETDIDTNNAVCEYMGRIFGYADILASLCRPGVPREAFDVRFASDAVGTLIGVDIDVEIVYIAERQTKKETGIFAGELCVSALLTYAMIARECSLERRLRLVIFYDGEDVFLRFSFAAEKCGLCVERLQLFSLIVKGHRELYFDIGKDDGEVWLETWPYYYDVGMAEVKHPDMFPLFRLHREHKKEY